MSNPTGFVWKGISFSWSATRASFFGATHLGSQMFLLFVRPSNAPNPPHGWESWCEFNSWHTAPCVMHTRDEALQGSVLELKSFFEAVATSASSLANRSSDPFHDHLDHCKQCTDHPFDLCAVGAPLLAAAATRRP